MDNPESSKSYSTQFLQQDDAGVHPLREAVEHLNGSGSDAKVYKYVQSFMMTQMTAKAGIKSTGKLRSTHSTRSSYCYTTSAFLRASM
jgi:hypothetical protein